MAFCLSIGIVGGLVVRTEDRGLRESRFEVGGLCGYHESTLG